MDRYQVIRIKGIDLQKATALATNANPQTHRVTAQTDKNYKYLKGIYVSLPDEYIHKGTTLSLKIGHLDLFDEFHQTRLLSCGANVSPNDMFFRIDGKIEAAGNEVEGKIRFTQSYGYDFDTLIYLWLTNAAD